MLNISRTKFMKEVLQVTHDVILKPTYCQVANVEKVEDNPLSTH